MQDVWRFKSILGKTLLTHTGDTLIITLVATTWTGT